MLFKHWLLLALFWFCAKVCIMSDIICLFTQHIYMEDGLCGGCDWYGLG